MENLSLFPGCLHHQRELSLQFPALTCSLVPFSSAFPWQGCPTASWASGATVLIISWFWLVCPFYDPHTCSYLCSLSRASFRRRVDLWPPDTLYTPGSQFALVTDLKSLAKTMPILYLCPTPDGKFFQSQLPMLCWKLCGPQGPSTNSCPLAAAVVYSSCLVGPGRGCLSLETKHKGLGE